MSVQELGAVHSRYVELSSRFKAAWTFHQFLQGLQNLSGDVDLGKYRVDFQIAYNSLRDLSQHLATGIPERLQMQVEFVARQLAQQVDALVAADARISPSLLRQFFDRVKNHDEQILAQMVRFYLYAVRDSRWNPDRLDKVDFLVTKLAEQPVAGTQQLALRESVRLRELVQSFWSVLGMDAVDPTEVAAHLAEVRALRDKIGRVTSLEELNESGLVKEYRDLKHGWGGLLLEPELLMAVIEANLAVKNAVRGFYRLEEQRIVSEYQQVFDLESRTSVDGELDAELSSLREKVDRFESKQRSDDLKVEEVLEIRRQVQSLLPKLAGEPAPTSANGAAGPSTGERESRSGSRLGLQLSDPDLLDETFTRIVDVLDETPHDSPPKTVAVLREVFQFRLEPREVVAYRRLSGRGEGELALEQFLLEAAALRVRINDEVVEITGILDETAVTREAPVFARARLTTRLADSFVQSFQHHVDQAIQDGNFSEAQALQLLRMRLIRDYSGLWLLVNRPSN